MCANESKANFWVAGVIFIIDNSMNQSKLVVDIQQHFENIAAVYVWRHDNEGQSLRTEKIFYMYFIKL